MKLFFFSNDFQSDSAIFGVKYPSKKCFFCFLFGPLEGSEKIGSSFGKKKKIDFFHIDNIILIIYFIS